uniref:Uncharacterized protein n=1 Tax=Rhizophora mucronata TaxID=61149 RepID=A0A2P2QU58_RHIMU
MINMWLWKLINQEKAQILPMLKQNMEA